MYEKIRETLTEKVNNIFWDLQKEHGITSGDIMPMDSIALEDCTEKLACIIWQVINYQKGE